MVRSAYSGGVGLMQTQDWRSHDRSAQRRNFVPSAPERERENFSNDVDDLIGEFLRHQSTKKLKG
jgi:hypothetical protein